MIRTEVHGSTLVMTLDNPGSRNAITVKDAHRVAEICAEVTGDLAIACVIVTGAGGSFCSGADTALLRDIGADPLATENLAALDAVYDSFLAVRNLPVPTIAAVNGAAVGAGVNLMMSCDVRVVAEDAKIISGFLRRGLHPGGGHLRMLAEATNAETATAMGIFGASLSGREAVTRGLAWTCCPADDVVTTAVELAARADANIEVVRRAARTVARTCRSGGTEFEMVVETERVSQLRSMRLAAMEA